MPQNDFPSAVNVSKVVKMTGIVIMLGTGNSKNDAKLLKTTISNMYHSLISKYRPKKIAGCL